MALTASERSLRGKIGAARQHALHDVRETTRAARAASPQSVDYWETHTVDSDGNIIYRDPAEIARLGPAEIARRARCDHKAYFARLAFKSAKARRARREAT